MVNTQYQYLQEAKDNTQYQYCQDAKVNTQYQYQYQVLLTSVAHTRSSNSNALFPPSSILYTVATLGAVQHTAYYN